jgi:hypothetical protein
MIEEQHQPYDKSSKWLIQHHGDSLLRLAKIHNIQTWRPAQAEIVQPRQLPDGLLEVRLQGEAQDDLFLLEVATYPERRVGEQLTRDLMLVYLDRGELPEAVTLVLRPKGKYRVPRSRNLRSRHGLSSCRLKWRLVELWTIPAEELLEAQDVGLIPWVPLTDFSDSPETMIRRCRDAIEQHAPPAEKANLLAVTQVLTYLRYNDLGLLTILGGRQVMLESPLIDELFAEKYGELLTQRTREVTRETACETAHQYIVTVLETRFGDIPRDLAEGIGSVSDEEQLKGLVRKAVACPDLEAFRNEIERR